METRLILYLTVLFFIAACSNSGNKDIVQNCDSSQNTDVQIPIQKKIFGEDLFEKIKDTLRIKSLDYETLINSKWEFHIADNCINEFHFNQKNIGKITDCEIEETFEIKYKIIDDTLFVEEYSIPHVDNPEGKMIKSRDDIYVYNGHSLIMVGSTMYNIGGKSWTPKIKAIIEYRRK
jgi:hypothetical protein